MDSERKFTMGEFSQAALTSCDELRSRIEEAFDELDVVRCADII